MNGTLVELEDSTGNAYQAYVSPPRGGRGPGIVMGIDIHGLRPLYHEVADLFAAQGYLAVVPDLFWDVPRGADGSYRTTMRFPTLLEVTRSTMNAARTMPGCNGRIGVTGFCVGGNTAFLSVARFGAEAATSYYGTRIHTFLDEIGAIEKPVILHIAEHDPTYPDSERDRILEAVKRNPLITAHVYAAPHGFATSVYDAKAAALAHQRSFELFDTLK